jgi:hypothetical protein
LTVVGIIIESSTKQKVLELYKTGVTSPYDILKEINKQGMKISYGSIYNLIKNHKKASSRVLSAQNIPARVFSTDAPITNHTPVNNPVQLFALDDTTRASFDAGFVSPTSSNDNSSVTDVQQQEVTTKLTPDLLSQEHLQKQQEAQTTSINTSTPLIAVTGPPLPISNPPNGSGLPPAKNSGNPLQRFLNEISIAGDKEVRSTSVKTLYEPTFASDDANIASEQVNIAPIDIINERKEIVPQDGTAQEANKNEQPTAKYYKPESPIEISDAEDTSRGGQDSQGYKTETTTTPVDSPNSIEAETEDIDFADVPAPEPVYDIDYVNFINSGCNVKKQSQVLTSSESESESELETMDTSWIQEVEEEKERKQAQTIEDWDNGLWQSRIFREIMADKKERNKQLLLIEQQRQEIAQGFSQLEEERQRLAQLRESIDQQKAELQQTIPLARQLQSMQIDITRFLPYVELLHDYSQAHNIDLTTAAFEIVRNLKVFKDLEQLRNAIGETKGSIQQLQVEKQRTEQELAMLNMSLVKQRDVIGALGDLQAAGFNNSQIAELAGLVSIWNGIGQGPGLNVFGQGNGSGSKSKLGTKSYT